MKKYTQELCTSSRYFQTWTAHQETQCRTSTKRMEDVIITTVCRDSMCPALDDPQRYDDSDET